MLTTNAATSERSVDSDHLQPRQRPRRAKSYKLPKIIPPDDYYRTCSDCKAEIHWSEMGLGNSDEYGIGYRCRACSAKSYAQYRAENYDKERVRLANIRAARAGAVGNFTVEEWLARQVEFGNACAYCGLNQPDLHIDHIEPISAGGSNWISNILPSCSFCNFAKRDRPLIIFLLWKAGQLAY